MKYLNNNNNNQKREKDDNLAEISSLLNRIVNQIVECENYDRGAKVKKKKTSHSDACKEFINEQKRELSSTKKQNEDGEKKKLKTCEKSSDTLGKKAERKRGESGSDVIRTGEGGFLPQFFQMFRTEETQRVQTSFVQKYRCLELPKYFDASTTRLTDELSSCRECCMLSCEDKPKVEKKEDEVSMVCRFVGWRLLKLAYHNVDLLPELQVVGFLGIEDAKEEDIEIWNLGNNSSSVNETEKKIYAKLLETIGNHFKDLIEYEIKMRSNFKKESNVWKRQIQNTREVCDQCGTTIFNGHFICETCGFLVCLKCQELRLRNKCLHDKTCEKTSNSSIRDKMNWYYCWQFTKTGRKAKQGKVHEPDKLVYAQYILPHILNSVYWSFNNYNISKIGLISQQASLTNGVDNLSSSGGNGWGRFLLLDCSLIGEQCLQDIFDAHWAERKPIVIQNVHRRLNSRLWTPNAFCKDFGHIDVHLMNCRNNKVLANMVPMREFWDGFEDETMRLRDLTGRRQQPMILKLKDWPTTDDFREILPSRFIDLMKNFPVRKLTSRDGLLNLISFLPKIFCVPDLGPKLYVAYSSALTPKEGTTNLHVDISDAVNLLIYASKDVHKIDDQTSNCNRGLLDVLEKSGCSKNQIERYKKGEIPGALWHIFNPTDADEIRTFLVKKQLMRGKKVKTENDPIHDQINYIDDQMLKNLREVHNVVPHIIVQFLGDAIFLPAGAPHQVRNLNSCIKVALDFVSAEGIDQCLIITDQLRYLSEKHSNREDKLQIKNIIYHTVKKCLTILKDN